ncbi:MAG: cytochrome c [Pseudomonadota bacterium]
MRLLAIMMALSGMASFICIAKAADDRDAMQKRGQVDYGNYCASCHGHSGMGDGPLQKFLLVEVPDITQLAIRNNGEYPENYVAQVIDGRGDVFAHGPREMPIWGNAFRAEQGLPALAAGKPQDKTTLSRIRSLAAYVATLQSDKGQE